MAKELLLRTPVGRFAAIDFGGEGSSCLLIHGTGQNAEAWRRFGTRLARKRRVVAFDMRGHGRTPMDSTDSTQYWRDIEAVIGALGFDATTLVGHSTGGYAATAFAAAGGRCASIVCVEGFTLDRQPAAASPLDEDSLFAMFRYGWEATSAQRDAYIAHEAARAPEDWLNRGVPPEALSKMLRRCFVRRGEHWLRRPTMDEISVVSRPPPPGAPAPARTLYEAIEAPMLLVWASDGLSKDRRAEVAGIAAERDNRRFATIEGTHNLPMQRWDDLARRTETFLGDLGL